MCIRAHRDKIQPTTPRRNLLNNNPPPNSKKVLKGIFCLPSLTIKNFLVELGGFYEFSPKDGFSFKMRFPEQIMH